MIDVRRLRAEPEALAAALARKGVDAAVVAEAAEADRAWRELQNRVDALRQQKNEGSRNIGRAPATERPRLIDEMNAVKAKLDSLEQALTEADTHRQLTLDTLPNPPDDVVPDGGEDDGRVLTTHGDAPPLDDGRLDYAAAGEHFGLWDLARGAKASGSRFAYLTGAGVLLEQALIRLALGIVLDHGLRPTAPPVLVRERAMYGTGFFPAERFEYYEVDGGELFLVGTSEVPLAALHADEILDEVPLRYAGLSTCFRREAGSYGRDTAGIFRVHQFQKLEMFAFVAADESRAEHERLLAIEEQIVQAVGLPYRVVDIAARDLGAPAVRKFDVEGWLPSEGKYREITSCSNCTDFQARRLQIRRRADSGPELVHTLNGTAVTDRWLCFIAEHFQRDDILEVPAALRPHMADGTEVIHPVRH